FHWTQPDLQMEFIFNGNHEPPILTLPDEYAAKVMTGGYVIPDGKMPHAASGSGTTASGSAISSSVSSASSTAPTAAVSSSAASVMSVPAASSTSTSLSSSVSGQAASVSSSAVSSVS